jgi:hypothetical protein
MILSHFCTWKEPISHALRLIALFWRFSDKTTRGANGIPMVYRVLIAHVRYLRYTTELCVHFWNQFYVL